ncbi:MAG: DUF935 family protein [Gammaproteobacteria bacterium]|nr:DUF935 family protein [Gammaproteobacteria bacterium]
MKKLKRKAPRILPGQEVGARNTDPWLSALWTRLPNPDAVLKRRGESQQQEIFDRVMLDAHVIGELRAVRAGLLGFEWRIVPGGSGRAAKRATDLARAVMARPPDAATTWHDLIWTMALAVFRGYAVHDVVWEKFGADTLPARIIDRPQRRFVFGAEDNQLRVLTRRDAVNGEAVAPRQALLTRHMPTFDNPYGLAVFSACLWPYLFKHAGFKFFTQFTEKYGVPFMVAKHPPGWNAEQVDELVGALGKLAANGAGAVEDGVEMLPLAQGAAGSAAAATPQERLIRACNMELSKALTSQTLATEVQGQGSRAASETHMAREQTVHVSDRAMISASLNTLFRWLTDLNLGPDAAAPTHHFYEEDEARTEWAELIGKARLFLPIKKEEAYARVGLTPPAEGDEVLDMGGGAGPGAGGDGGHPRREPRGARSMSRCPNCGGFHFAAGGDDDDPLLEAIDAALAGELDAAGIAESMAGAMIKAAADAPDELSARLAERYPDLDAKALENLLAKLFFVADLLGDGEGDA